MSGEEHAPRSRTRYGIFGNRTGFSLASGGILGFILDYFRDPLRRAARAYVSIPVAVAAFVASVLGTVYFNAATKDFPRTVVAEKRYSLSRDIAHQVRASFLARTGDRAEVKRASMSKRSLRRRAIYVSFADQATYTTLVALRITSMLGLLVVPLVAISVHLWRRREEDASAAFGRGTPDYDEAMREVARDPVAEEAARDWLLNRPGAETRRDPENRRRPVFGRAPI